jgi:galactosylceramidase
MCSAVVVGLIVMAATEVTLAQVAVPENPGFTPEQAAAMEQQARQRKWADDALCPKNPVAPAQTQAVVRISGKSGGRKWGGIGSAPSNAMGRMLPFYPEELRNDILDLMFKPNWGMALTHLKVEVGGDNNSTSGTEPSFAHTREEMAKPNFHRGYLYQLMRDARDRNPGIELGALAWTQPYWVGNGTGRNDNKSFYTPESAEYFVKFFEGARKEWGLEMQYFSAEQNERNPTGRRNWVINDLRPAFDTAGLQHVQFIIDNAGWPLRAEDKDSELLKQIAALGRHYVENDPKKMTTSEALASGKPLLAAESWSRIGQNWPLAIYLAESVARCYTDSKITQFTTWPLQGGGLAGCMYNATGLMAANKPWCGFYEIYPTVWMAAHFNQFAPMGWETIDSGCGSLFVESNPVYDEATGVPTGVKEKGWPRARLYYLTLKSPDSKDYSIIVVNSSPFARTLDVELQDLPLKPLHAWRTTREEQFIRTGSIDTGSGKFTLVAQPWAVYSLTTTTGQHKGQPKQAIPSDTLLPLPYGDDFESYSIGADARYTHSVAGYFEVYQAPGEGKTLRQMVPAKGLTWAIPKDNYPCVVIGDVRWGDYEVSSDALLEGQGNVALWARVNAFRDHGLAGYYLRVDQAGKWELGVANNRRGKNKFYTEKALATGHLAAFTPDAWHKLALRVEGSLLRASVDGKQVVEIKNGTYAAGAVGYSTWAEGIQKDHEDMKKAMVIGTKYGQARYDNLLVRPVRETARKKGEAEK